MTGRRCDLDVLRLLQHAPAAQDREQIHAAVTWNEFMVDEALADLVIRGQLHFDPTSRRYCAALVLMEAL